MLLALAGLLPARLGVAGWVAIGPARRVRGLDGARDRLVRERRAQRAGVGRLAAYLGVLVLAIVLQGRTAARHTVAGLASAIGLVTALAVLGWLHPQAFPRNDLTSSSSAPPARAASATRSTTGTHSPRSRRWVSRCCSRSRCAVARRRACALAAADAAAQRAVRLPDRLARRRARARRRGRGLPAARAAADRGARRAAAERRGRKRCSCGSPRGRRRSRAASRRTRRSTRARCCSRWPSSSAGRRRAPRTRRSAARWRLTAARSPPRSRRDGARRRPRARRRRGARPAARRRRRGRAGDSSSSAWHDFEQPTGVVVPSRTTTTVFARLQAANGNGRYQFWQAAWHALEAHPWGRHRPRHVRVLVGAPRERATASSATPTRSTSRRSPRPASSGSRCSAGCCCGSSRWPCGALAARRPRGCASGSPRRRAGLAAFLVSAALEWVWQLAAIAAAALILGAVIVAGRDESAPADVRNMLTPLGPRAPRRCSRSPRSRPCSCRSPASWSCARAAPQRARGDLTAPPIVDALAALSACSPRGDAAPPAGARARGLRAARRRRRRAARAATAREGPTDWQTWLALARIDAERGADALRARGDTPGARVSTRARACSRGP